MSGCVKKSTKKYLSRKSPPFPANRCRGRKMMGNDGQMYLSVNTVNNVCRWVKVVKSYKGSPKKIAKSVKKSVKKSARVPRKPSSKSYLIHDNGGRPFKVYVNGKKHVTIAKNAEEVKDVEKTLFEIDADEVHIGKRDPKDVRNANYPGNTILLRKGDKYIFVGPVIYEFVPVKGDQIVKFFSPVGNSDVPYPYAVGQQFLYFFDDFKNVAVMDRDLFDLSQEPDPYGLFYDTHNHKDKKKLRVKVLHKRRY